MKNPRNPSHKQLGCKKVSRQWYLSCHALRLMGCLTVCACRRALQKGGHRGPPEFGRSALTQCACTQSPLLSGRPWRSPSTARYLGECLKGKLYSSVARMRSMHVPVPLCRQKVDTQSNVWRSQRDRQCTARDQRGNTVKPTYNNIHVRISLLQPGCIKKSK